MSSDKRQHDKRLDDYRSRPYNNRRTESHSPSNRGGLIHYYYDNRTSNAEQQMREDLKIKQLVIDHLKELIRQKDDMIILLKASLEDKTRLATLEKRAVRTDHRQSRSRSRSRSRSMSRSRSVVTRRSMSPSPELGEIRE